MDKIEKLKDNIDQEYDKDPTEKLKEKMKEKNLKCSLKTVTEKQVLEAMKDMKKKKSDTGVRSIGGTTHEDYQCINPRRGISRKVEESIGDANIEERKSRDKRKL